MEKPKSGTQAPKRLSTEAAKVSGTDSSSRTPLALQGTAKSKHPEFQPVKIYIRSSTRKAAERKWEDRDGGDFSDLVQQLLEKYLSA
jgi:hypothetical protein